MRVRRVTVVDEYVEDGQAVVLVDGNVVALSPLATVALHAIGQDWTALESVAAALVSAFGPPPGDLSEACLTTMAALRDAGLLEVEPAARLPNDGTKSR